MLLSPGYPNFMDLKKLSLNVKVERGSIALKFPDAIVLEYSAPVFNSLKSLLLEIQKTAWPDRGFSFSLTDTTRISSGGIKLILKVVDYVINNDGLNMDIWIADNPSDEVKSVVKEVEDKLIRADNRSIRIRQPKERTGGDLNKFLMVNWFSGLACILLGSTKLFEASHVIKTEWFEGITAIQLIGAVMVSVALLPYVFKYAKSFIKK